MESLLSILHQQSEKLNEFERIVSYENMTLEEVGRQSDEIFHYSDENFKIKYLNPTGCRWFGIGCGNAINMGENFFKKFYHRDMVNVEIPNIKSYFKHHTSNSVYSGYQQVFNLAENDFVVCLVFIKKYNVSCGYLSLILPFLNYLGINNKIKRIIEEVLFRYNHQDEFKQLTERESEILRLVALGKSNPEISKELFISRCTVEQHRKNINKKLHVKGLKPIMDFAYAFDLV
jgi:hypothetical protein